MIGVLRLADRIVVALVRLAGAIAALLILFCALAIFAGVVARMSGIPMGWPSEIVPHLLVVAVMLAAAECFRRGEHIAVDFITGRLRARARRIVSIWASATVIFLAVLLVSQGLEMIAFSRMTGMRTFDRLDFPVWWVESVIPVGGALLGLAALRALVAALFGRSDDGLAA
jgi:TRAP-type C4-dicarboxylate transport system permease small subunit